MRHFTVSPPRPPRCRHRARPLPPRPPAQSMSMPVIGWPQPSEASRVLLQFVYIWNNGVKSDAWPSSARLKLATYRQAKVPSCWSLVVRELRTLPCRVVGVSNWIGTNLGGSYWFTCFTISAVEIPSLHNFTLKYLSTILPRFERLSKFKTRLCSIAVCFQAYSDMIYLSILQLLHCRYIYLICNFCC